MKGDIMWELIEAINLCRELQNNSIFCKPRFNVALTGSILKKGFSEKDLDIILYPHKSRNSYDNIEYKKVFQFLLKHGFSSFEECNHQEHDDTKLVFKCQYKNKRVDIFIMS